MRCHERLLVTGPGGSLAIIRFPGEERTELECGATASKPARSCLSTTVWKAL